MKIFSYPLDTFLSRGYNYECLKWLSIYYSVTGEVLMKRNYASPLISFKSLTAGGTVSSGCSGGSPSFQMGGCAIRIPEWNETVYSDDVPGGCDIDFIDFPCFDVPLMASDSFES